MDVGDIITLFSKEDQSDHTSVWNKPSGSCSQCSCWGKC
jgi:hypothetical protein